MSECSVCLEDVELSNPDTVVLPCNHVFHSHCIEDWRTQQPQQQEVTCPNCRHGVQQESMQELIRPFECLDLILIPVMLVVSYDLITLHSFITTYTMTHIHIWIGQGVFITFPQTAASKVVLLYTWVYNLPYRHLIPFIGRKCIFKTLNGPRNY